MADSWRQLRAMLRKNWLLKLRHPYVTCAEILLPTIVMLMLIAVRIRADMQIHPAQPYIRKDMLVEVGKGDISPPFNKILEMLLAKNEFLAFAPDTKATRRMIKLMSLQYPMLELVAKIYKDEADLETYIRSDIYGTCKEERNCTNPFIKGAVVFHDQGPHLYDYSIRLNHTWAFSGFPNVKTIMDVNGPYLNDLELGVNNVPILQYSLSGFFTLQQVLDSFIIFTAKHTGTGLSGEGIKASFAPSSPATSSVRLPGMQFIPSNIRIAPFPTREYIDDEFQSIIKSFMGVLYLLGFLYPISRLISYMVFEKEQRIKEGLYMMGLKNEIFYLSWFITYALQFAVSSAVLTLCTMGSLFKYSDNSVVFSYFFFFGLSAMTLSFLISSFFNRAKTAVAVGTLSFMGAFFPYYTINDPGISMILKVSASLLSPTAFALGSINLADYERAHVGLRWSNMWRESSGVNFSVCLLMLLVDTILYGLIGAYLDKVLSKKHNQCSWNPLGMSKKNSGSKHHATVSGVNMNACISGEKVASGKDALGPVVEPISSDMKQQERDGRCLQIRNLHKLYTSRKGKCCAVNSLQLTLYENQILALLGHNGAGKSTTISMLVGLLPPTSGDALVLGKNILTNMDDIRKDLGVCPQHDILFPELSVKEHLQLFAALKGLPENDLDDAVTHMIDEVGLFDKVDTLVSALSGGMKRKLSLGIALIGNSKVIILDEPTSGMDPYSMRMTWQLIRKIKKGRTVLLTTHSMDEAEVLGDRIAIMANGSLKCCGSSLFLKHQYGVGYTLTLVKTAPGASVVTDIVWRHVPSATLVSEVGTEVCFRLPLASSSCFESMFQEIERYIKKSDSRLKSNGVEDNCSAVESYGISVTTLEEVFLRVAGGDVYESKHESHVEAFPDDGVKELCHPSLPLESYSSKQYEACISAVIVTLMIVWRTCVFVLATVWGVLNFVSTQCYCSVLTKTEFWQHTKALVRKRAISARRDQKTVVFQLVIPAVFLLIGLIFLKLKPHPDQQSVMFTTEHFNPLLSGSGGGGPIPFDLSWPISKKVASHIRGGWIQKFSPTAYRFPDSEKALEDAIGAAGFTLGPKLLSMSEFLMSSFAESYQSRYGAIVMDNQESDGSIGYTVLHNSSCQHAAPTYINLMNAATLRLATSDRNMSIRTRNHPLPMTESQHLQHHDLDAFSAAIIINIAFSFIPASFAVPIVKEREVKAKHQQLISGVSIISYWMSTFLWDVISFLFPSSLAFVLFYIFGLDQFIGAGTFWPTVLLFVEYGLAVASSTYCLTFCFSDHSMAQNVVLLIHFLTGLILMVISFIMGLIEATASANSYLKNIFRLSPGFCFADGLASLALLRQGMKDTSSDGVLDWNVTGASICYLAFEGVLYFALTIGLECGLLQKLVPFSIKCFRRSINNIFYGSSSDDALEPLLGSSTCSVAPDRNEDKDVQAERQRVLSGAVNNAILYLCNLCKVYPRGTHQGGKVAVNSLTFSVQEGECFGFLGTNGAGKTTTLSMLSGEECPTAGTAFVFGKDICADPKAVRKHIGYCPQFDALLEHLTVKEHLELYARIKGVSDFRIKEVVDQKMAEFDLLKHAEKPSFSLSGGNKRKLSVAIAMIGDPAIVILDEPSTGMDPIAKRFMWDVISNLSTRRGRTAVILTTHSMNEAQALCTRMGIMVGGQLRCIGSPQHLKTRFGNHLELEVKPSEVSSIELEDLSKMIQERISGVAFHPRSILSDLETCIKGDDSIVPENAVAAEIRLSIEMIVMVAQWLGNEDRVRTLLASTAISSDGVLGEQLAEQLNRDGGIPLPIFCKWWLEKEKFSVIKAFVLSSFPGATVERCNGLSARYQLPFGQDFSLADVFGHIERNRCRLGIAEYSVSQSTLETIFNHFAASSGSIAS